VFAISCQYRDLIISGRQILGRPAPAIGLGPFPCFSAVGQEFVEDFIVIRVHSHCFPENCRPFFLGAGFVRLEALQNRRPVGGHDGYGGIHGVVKGVCRCRPGISGQNRDLMVPRGGGRSVPGPGIGYRPVGHGTFVFQELVVYLIAVRIRCVGRPLNCVALHGIDLVGLKTLKFWRQIGARTPLGLAREIGPVRGFFCAVGG
jgi:hypothetical protein